MKEDWAHNYFSSFRLLLKRIEDCNVIASSIHFFLPALRLFRFRSSSQIKPSHIFPRRSQYYTPVVGKQ